MVRDKRQRPSPPSHRRWRASNLRPCRLAAILLSGEVGYRVRATVVMEVGGNGNHSTRSPVACTVAGAGAKASGDACGIWMSPHDSFVLVFVGPHQTNCYGGKIVTMGLLQT
ncbi:hypothetical protein ZWY2020_053165 [Hordeum vulgare]|nr:hypothetical protein ZWY2020_053165 [Hordeum vulgare]